MVCPACSKNIPENTETCPFCGEGRLFPLLRNISRIAAFFAKNIILFGIAGAILGTITSMIFYSYFAASFPVLRTSVYCALIVMYYFFGGTALWGYVGFLRGAARTMEFLIAEKNILMAAISKIVGSIMGYIEKSFFKSQSAKSGEPDIDNIAIPYETLKKAFAKWNSGESTATSGEENDPLKPDNGIKKLVVRFLMNGQLTKIIALQISHYYKMKKDVTFGELREKIVVLANFAGNDFLEDLNKKRIVLAFILIPIHLLIPFAAVYLALMLKH